MARRKNWLDRLKKFFTSDTQTKQEKKEMRKRWLFGRLKTKFSPALPPPSLLRLRSLREAEQEQSIQAVAVAIATAAAAEAAVAAAQAAAKVVRLAGNSVSFQKTLRIAATKIQTMFRAYLARRALRALRGLVKLQALIRGQAVRRQASVTLKGLLCLMKIQSQARANRMRTACIHEYNALKDVFHVNGLKGEFGHVKPQNNDRLWNDSILSKEEIISLLKKRQEAAFKRERAMNYASTHQDRNLSRIESHPRDRDIHEVSPPHGRVRMEGIRHLHSSGPMAEKAGSGEFELVNPARRSFNRPERAQSKDDGFLGHVSSSASTAAKYRSASTPKQRRGSSFSKEKIFSPLNHQRSPRLKGNGGNVKNFSIDSERSLLNWERSGLFGE